MIDIFITNIVSIIIGTTVYLLVHQLFHDKNKRRKTLYVTLLMFLFFFILIYYN